MGYGPVFIMLNSAVDVWFHERGAALHYLARVHTALAGVRGAPVHPGTPAHRPDNITTSERTQKLKFTKIWSHPGFPGLLDLQNLLQPF